MGELKEQRVFIVDDHPLVRQGLIQLIGHEPGIAVCGEAGDIETCLKAVPKAEPDVVIVDLSLGTGSGVRLIEELRSRQPSLRILVLSMLDEAVYAERCLRAGATGYIMKSEPPQQVIQAIRKVLAGGVAVSDDITSRLLTGRVDAAMRLDSPQSLLTNRELEVFELLGQGLSSQAIADTMHRSVKTIHTHIERMKKKLRLRDYHELLAYAGKSLNDRF